MRSCRPLVYALATATLAFAQALPVRAGTIKRSEPITFGEFVDQGCAVSGPDNLFTVEPECSNVLGGTATPDFRLILFARHMPGVYDAHLRTDTGIYGMVLRHEVLDTSNGSPDFGAANVWSPKVRVLADAIDQKTFDAYTRPPINASPSQLPPVTQDGTMNIAWPQVSPYPGAEVPYASDLNANAIFDGSFPPAFVTYHLMFVLSSTIFVNLGTFDVTQIPQTDVRATPFEIDPATGQLVFVGGQPKLDPTLNFLPLIQFVPIKIVVADPYTPQASIANVIRDEPARTPYYPTATVNSPFIGIEPGFTASGRVTTFLDAVQNEPSSIFIGDAIPTDNQQANPGVQYPSFSINPTPFATAGWSTPQPVNRMHTIADNAVDPSDPSSVTWGDVFPHARGVLKGSDCTPVPDVFNMDWNYWWPSQTPGPAVMTGNALHFWGPALFSAQSNFTAQLIDGAVQHQFHSRTRGHSGVGPSATWFPGLGMGTPPLPYTGKREELLLYNPWRGAAFSAAQYPREDYVFVLEGTGGLDYSTLLGDWVLNSSYIADQSGNCIKAIPHHAFTAQQYRLQRGDCGPTAHDCDRVYGVSDGFVGQTRFLPDGAGLKFGTIEVPAGPHFDDMRSFTLEMSVNLQTGVPAAPQALRWLSLKLGTFVTAVDRTGRVYAAIWVGGQLKIFVTPEGVLMANPWPGGTPPEEGWHHVALSYDERNGKAILWVDGVEHGSTSFSPGPVDQLGFPALFGPGLTTPQVPSFGYVAMDNIMLWRAGVAPSRFAGNRNTAQQSYSQPEASPWKTTPTFPGLPAGLAGRESFLKIPNGATTTQPKADLGEVLFFDEALSDPPGISCGSCHQPEADFADTTANSLGVGGTTLRNTPAVFNRAFAAMQFHDGRAVTLEEQSTQPIENAIEMGSSVEAALDYINGPGWSNYGPMVESAFGAGPMTQNMLEDSIAAFVRSIVAGDSPVDRYEAGLKTPRATILRGREIFYGKGQCVRCHHGPNLSDEYLGLFHDTPIASTDPGRFKVTGIPSDRGKFKTPTLRNLEATAPYFHNGSVSTLSEVVEIYNEGGRNPDNQELTPLLLTEPEKNDLTTFLQDGLAGTVVVTVP